MNFFEYKNKNNRNQFSRELFEFTKLFYYSCHNLKRFKIKVAKKSYFNIFWHYCNYDIIMRSFLL